LVSGVWVSSAVSMLYANYWLLQHVKLSILFAN
jgi:hypothetical protein